jgi:DNA-binding XRE family transcriptional regulator
VPLFYATVELTGLRRPEAAARAGNPTAELVPGIRDELHAAGELSRPPSLAVLSTKQQNGLGNYISRIALRESSPEGSGFFAMKSTRRWPTSVDVRNEEPIRTHRPIVGMTQGDLARRLGVSFQQIQGYEKGANRVAAGRLPRIARICAVDFSDGEASH